MDETTEAGKEENEEKRMKGRLFQCQYQFFNKCYEVTFFTEDAGIKEIFESLKDKVCSFDIKQYREKRTLSANAYYWKLVGELAKKQKLSAHFIHNINLRELSILDHIDDQVIVICFPDSADETLLKSEKYHVTPTSRTHVATDGTLWRDYLMLKGSHEFNKSEFSRLLENVIQDCKAMGIETKPQWEIDAMLEQYAPAKK